MRRSQPIIRDACVELILMTPDGGTVPYQRIAELTFQNDALQSGLESAEGPAAVNDIPNFATGDVTISPDRRPCG